jgi:hypothetical protein
MTTENAGNRGTRGQSKQRQKKRRGGRKPPPSIDWAELHAQVLRELDGLRRSPRSERTYGSASVTDAVQTVITELYAEQQQEERTQEELFELAVRRARSRLAYWSRRERRRAAKAAEHAQHLTTRDLFETILARDEQRKFLKRMREELAKDPEGAFILAAMLEGVPFEDTRLLADLLGTTKVRVTNIKRRLVRLAAKIMKELRPPSGPGGGK